jgi:hypothetical protein
MYCRQYIPFVALLLLLLFSLQIAESKIQYNLNFDNDKATNTLSYAKALGKNLLDDSSSGEANTLFWCYPQYSPCKMGTCVFGFCACQPGWSGYRCDVPLCFTDKTLKGCAQGTCVARDTCQCNKYYRGDRCDIYDVCAGNDYCYRGRCTGLESCQCEDNWWGAKCDKYCGSEVFTLNINHLNLYRIQSTASNTFFPTGSPISYVDTAFEVSIPKYAYSIPAQLSGLIYSIKHTDGSFITVKDPDTGKDLTDFRFQIGPDPQLGSCVVTVEAIKPDYPFGYYPIVEHKAVKSGSPTRYIIKKSDGYMRERM